MEAALSLLAEQVRRASAAGRALCIRAGGSKDFYGNESSGERLDAAGLQGIIAYEPSELFVTARAGTPLAQLETTLAGADQMLAFEPPHFGPHATIGGCVAAGLAGPRRAAAGFASGSVRDSVLGARLLDGRGQLLGFGGTVMKNVAGYDMARALAGSLGILGLIVAVSLKVVPRPAAEVSLRFAMDAATALERLRAWCAQPLPISASAWCAGELTLRLSGERAAVRVAAERLGGEALDLDVAAAHWRAIREQEHGYFTGDLPLWRVALPATAAPLGLAGTELLEWGGALRWLRTREPMAAIRARAAVLGGHATLFRGGDRAAGVFAPPSAAIMAIHRRLKAQFDPAGIFNPGRMYPGL